MLARTSSKLLIFLLLAVSALSCNRGKDAGRDSGKITFSISYAQEKVGGYSASVLPKEMIMEFNDGHVMNTIEGGFGFFRLIHLVDMRHNRHTTWLKFIDKRYIYYGGRNETPCCFGMLDGMQLEFTDSEKEIVGLECRKVIASFPGGEMEPFNIWYTEGIDLNNPNRQTPFSDIPGVLLEFDTFMGNAHMHMRATGYENPGTTQAKFQPPKDYREVSAVEMESILTALMK